VVLGVVTTLLGPVLPLLAARWSISTVQAADLFFWQFASSTTGTLLGGVAFSRRSFRLPILLGLGLCTVGVASLSFSSFSWGRMAASLFGLGLGMALPAINLAVADANPGHRAGSVSLLNFSWAIGAISGPALLLALRNLNLFLLSTASALAIALIGSIFVPGMMWRREEADGGFEAKRGAGQLTTIFLFAAMMFLFVGVENAIAGWASSLAMPSFSSAYTATVANIAFWTCFLLGRALAPLALRKISEQRLMYAGVLCALSGVAVFYFASSAAPIVIACSLAGLGIAPGFPVVISRLTEKLGAHSPFSAICFACAGIGGATIPPLVGRMGAYLGHPKMGLAIPFLALIGLYWLPGRISPVVLQAD
jgi:fucose permease